MRVERLKDLHFWQSNPVDENNLCPPEVDFLKDYEKLVRQHQSKVGISFDLRSQALPPQPFDRVQVRVCCDGDNQLFDQGPIVLESGVTVVFTKGSTHNLLFTDIEEYLRSGDLELLPGEETI